VAKTGACAGEADLPLRALGQILLQQKSRHARQLRAEKLHPLGRESLHAPLLLPLLEKIRDHTGEETKQKKHQRDADAERRRKPHLRVSFEKHASPRAARAGAGNGIDGSCRFMPCCLSQQSSR
jgi:hypothetical protein